MYLSFNASALFKCLFNETSMCLKKSHLNSHTHMYGIGIEEGTNVLEKWKTWHMMPLELLSKMYVSNWNKTKTFRNF